tara:strand:- start:239 stop:565 length:327 start_codon:yes stop_codon:yes gene_type:complete
MLKSFIVSGKVQGVMFRQTFIRGLLKRKLIGGATNNLDRSKSVTISIDADEEVIQEVINELRQIKIINSWNATIEEISEIPPVPTKEHQVTTQNVDQFNWSTGVDFYF